MIKNNVAAKNDQPVRTLLIEGIIASVKIPKKAKLGSLPNNPSVKYFQFAFYLKGGCINVFLHSDDVSLIGTFVRAHVEVHHKEFKDGRGYIHVDLHPVVGKVKETNNLFFVPHMDVERLPHWQVLETSPEQGKGLIIIADVGESYPVKIEPKAETPPALPTMAAATKPDLPARVKPPKVPKKKSSLPTASVKSLADLRELMGAK